MSCRRLRRDPKDVGDLLRWRPGRDHPYAEELSAAVQTGRPLAGFLSLAGAGTAPGERMAIALFDVRGIGSIYYLAYALNEADFVEGPKVWAVVAFVVLVSVVLHGITALPIMRRLDDRRTARRAGG